MRYSANRQTHRNKQFYGHLPFMAVCDNTSNPFFPPHFGLNVVLCFSGVIAVVIFVTMSALAIMARFICTRKETFRNHEVKAAQPDDSHEFPFSSQADSLGENQKEFFI